MEKEEKQHKAKKLSEEHLEECSGCALCDHEPPEDPYIEYQNQEVKELNTKV